VNSDVPERVAMKISGGHRRGRCSTGSHIVSVDEVSDAMRRLELNGVVVKVW